MLDKYVKIIDQIKDQILFITEDISFIMGEDFMRFKFKTNDSLPYNQKINSVFEKNNWYYPQTNLQGCFYENCNYDY